MNRLAEAISRSISSEEAVARTASQVYAHADTGSAVPAGGVHWTWVDGEDWEPVTPDPMLNEFVSQAGHTSNLATTEEWPASGGFMRRTYADSIVEMDSAAAMHIIRNDPARVISRCAANRRILEEHMPQWATTEWPAIPDDQGFGWTCPTCRPRNPVEWRAALRQADTITLDGFIRNYDLAPCPTLAALAEACHVWAMIA